MKILKNGNWYNPWSANLICGICSAELLVEEKDLIPNYNTIDYNEYKCPECQKLNSVPRDILPLRVLEALNSKRKYSSTYD